jgi:hypothetical protein
MHEQHREEDRDTKPARAPGIYPPTHMIGKADGECERDAGAIIGLSTACIRNTEPTLRTDSSPASKLAARTPIGVGNGGDSPDTRLPAAAQGSATWLKLALFATTSGGPRQGSPQDQTKVRQATFEVLQAGPAHCIL